MNADARLTALFGGQYVEDPYPLYAELRAERPAHRHGSSVVVVDHGLARQIFHDSDHFPGTVERGVKLDDRFSLLSAHELSLAREIEDVERDYLTAINGAPHHRVRTAAQREFNPRRLAQIRDAIARLADELLDRGLEQDQIDLIELAFRLPLLVVCDILGAERRDAEQLKRWSLDMTSAYSRSPIDPAQLRAAHVGMLRLREYFLELIEHNRRDPSRENLLATLDRDAEHPLGIDEIVANAISVIFAGHETSSNAIGNVVAALLADRRHWERVCADPALIPSAVEELLRHDAPVQFFIKGTTGGREVGGLAVERGASIVLAIGAANRDPKAFGAADQVDLTRRPNDHLCFGRGVHFCLGAPLARLEIQTVLQRIVTRFPGLELAVAASELRHREHISLRGLAELPVALGPERVGAAATR